MKSSNQNDCKGQIIILFAISLIALVGMVGLAIDSGRAYGVKAKMSAAVDAAAIAAARGLAPIASPMRKLQRLNSIMEISPPTIWARLD